MRKLLLPSIIIIGGSLLIIRLFYLQIINDTFKLKSVNNAIKINYDYPERGYIYDRNGELMVANQPSFDIMVTPRDIKNLDTLSFCTLLNVSKDEFLKKIAKAKVYSPMLRSVFLAQLNKTEFAAFQEKVRKFPGFEIQKRSLRDYQIDAGANVFGFITQVNDKIIQKHPYYNSGDLIGKQGVEESYEEVLRGVKGVKYIQKDKYNREMGSYNEGKFDTIAVQGKDITLTIDAELQKYGEALMINKRGGIVAIEPKTGEILALVTAPSYDPKLLVGRQRSRNYTMLYNDSLAKPTYDRGLLAEYPPGSPFKIMTGLIGLQEQVVDEQTTFFCHHGMRIGGHFQRCHGFGPHQLHNGIYASCNTYFASVYMRTINKYVNAGQAVDIWGNHVKSFGLGQFMGYDLPTGRKGNIPTSKYYKKIYPNGGWHGSTIVSNAIGQGEVLATPIQLANMIATVANQGFYYTPHIIKKIKGQVIDKKFRTKHVATIDKKYFPPVISGLFDVYNKGTAHGLQIPDINVCGKTGTAENYARVGGKKIKMHDHSIFVAFAPMENPKIAIAVLVENGGFGARIAGPIVSLMIEKYLKKKISLTKFETRIKNTSLESQYARFVVKPDDTLHVNEPKEIILPDLKKISKEVLQDTTENH
ncbi:MAG: penicillin-binding protein 2 [Flavobacterium sp.]|nr:penicillin-binding protein 2 [Flavobacterium sp.]